MNEQLKKAVEIVVYYETCAAEYASPYGNSIFREMMDEAKNHEKAYRLLFDEQEWNLALSKERHAHNLDEAEF